MNEAMIRKYFEVIRRAVDLAEQQLDADVSATFDKLMQETAVPPSTPSPNVNDAIRFTTPPLQHHPEPVVDQVHIEARRRHVEELMAIDCWPPAVPPHAVGPNSEEDEINRARAVIDSSLGCSIEGAHFLDYGCGEGYIAADAAGRGCAEVTGYDIESSPTWSRLDGVRYTRDQKSLKPHGYDLIFLYDVLDHCSDPEAIMDHIKDLAAPGAQIVVRCHPWTSRHGNHLPKIGLNKAFVHLFLTHEELVEQGYQPMFTRIEKNPLEAYHWWFRNFRIVKENIRKPQPLSDFFLVPSFKELLASEQELELSKIDDFLDTMTIDFVEYLLEAPK